MLPEMKARGRGRWRGGGGASAGKRRRAGGRHGDDDLGRVHRDPRPSSATPDLVGKIDASYLFKVTNPDSAWVVDLKPARARSPGAGAADCTLEISEADFIDMTTGKSDPSEALHHRQAERSAAT
ncbi:MAG: SCP2 sterol-binding domain-containing protein [Myxococcales bacterium]|nr:SCP2 sterol-binding domain-containing protein [Myxococcales bacterium]